MGLLNYTTDIDAGKTAGEISDMLRKAGAKAILTEYDEEGEYIASLSFKMNVQGQEMGFKLPCDWKPVHEVMYKNTKAYSTYDSRYESQKSKRKEQAVKTAWRIVHTWVKAQLAIIETKMVKTEGVFLPYAIMRDGRTLAQTIQEDPKFLLEGGN